jgi:ABC-type antimicrobial peptide transport system permease subunit
VAAAIVRHCAVLAVAGLVAGLLVVRLADTALATVLFGVAPSDPASSIVAAACLLGAALLASLVPAWRATKVNPIEGLRAE